MENKASSNLSVPTHHPRDPPIQPEKSIPSSEESCPTNQTMFQAFEWYSPSDNQHWRRLASTVPDLAALGITSMWIPPATKTAWRDSNGYDAYDLYDLGEFHQKGARSTKWGNKEELVDFVEIANANGVKVIFDAVLNHKAGADYVESVKASRVDPEGNCSQGLELGIFSKLTLK
jgi:alpha-amylase